MISNNDKYLKRASIIVLAFFAFQLNAQITLPKLIGDNMMIQRNSYFQLWGTSATKDTFKINIDNISVKAAVQEDGKWEATLPPMKHGGPYELQIGDLTLKNVMIGDVWFCSGQSNMEWPVKKSMNAGADLMKANNPNIRLFKIGLDYAAQPQEDLKEGSWKVSNLANIVDFSAVAYFFGRNIYDSTNIPIGIIQSAWGGSKIESFMSKDAFDKFTAYKPLIEELEQNKNLESMMDSLKSEGEDRMRSEIYKTDSGFNTDGTFNNEFHSKKWDKIILPKTLEFYGFSHFNGGIWFRKNIVATKEFTENEIILSLGMIDMMSIVYINGELVASYNWYGGFRRHKLPAGTLKEGDNEVVIYVINNGRQKGGFSAENDQFFIQSKGDKFDYHISLVGPWEYSIGYKNQVIARNKEGHPHHQPTLIYNAMIHPITKYQVRGYAWYQGESNVADHNNYRGLLESMINNWRSNWITLDAPFLVVQLANFMENNKEQPFQSDWAMLREAQFKACQQPLTALTVTIDIGDTYDIHPTNKQEVGRRLALNALRISYDKRLVPSGPMYESVMFSGSKAIINFNYVGSGLTSNNTYPCLNGFAIAGEDKQWMPAKALIKKDNTVVVYSDKVPKPVAVRYAWGNSPAHDLYNKEGLPAIPFRTDNWKK